MSGGRGDPVRPQQRHTRQHPCHACGGADGCPEEWVDTATASHLTAAKGGR